MGQGPVSGEGRATVGQCRGSSHARHSAGTAVLGAKPVCGQANRLREQARSHNGLRCPGFQRHAQNCIPVNAKSKASTKPVGVSLLTNAVGQATLMAQAESIREQAHSYSGSALAGVSASCTKPVGVSLLTNAVGQAELMAQAESIREQAHSYSGSALAGVSASCTEPVGVSLLTNAVSQARLMAQAESIREQAHSYRRCVLPRDFSVMRRTCGSQLADECGGSGKVDGTGRPHSRASSLLQEMCVAPRLQRHAQTCGSQLADECGGSGDVDGTGRPLSRASSLLQEMCVAPRLQRHAQNLWESAC